MAVVVADRLRVRVGQSRVVEAGALIRDELESEVRALLSLLLDPVTMRTMGIHRRLRPLRCLTYGKSVVRLNDWDGCLNLIEWEQAGRRDQDAVGQVILLEVHAFCCSLCIARSRVSSPRLSEAVSFLFCSVWQLCSEVRVVTIYDEL